MTAAQEKILLETHGLTQKIYGSHKALIEDVKRNRDDIAQNGGRIRDVETSMVTKAECASVQDKEAEAKRSNWSRGTKLILILFGLVNLLLGSGLVVTITRLSAIAAVP